MTVSILGCGWFGLALAKSLVSKGIQVNGSTTSPEKLEKLEADGIRPFLIDLSAEAEPDHVFFTCDILVIAIPPRSRQGEGAEYITKLQKAIDAIDVAGIQKVILVSSTGVYADLNRVVNENDDPQPNTPAGIVLHQAEQLFKNQTTFKTTILRFGGLVGPGRDPGRFFAGKADIPNGLAPINLIHLDDCIGITEAIINNDAFGETFNACAPHHPAKFAFYTQAAAKAGLGLPQFLPELKEWKIVESLSVDNVLHYKFAVNNWYDWLS